MFFRAGVTAWRWSDMRRALRLLAACISAVGFACAFPPSNHPWLAWITLSPFFVALQGLGWRRAAGLGFLWGLVAAYGVGDWFPRAITRYWDQPAWVGVVAFFVVAGGTGAVHYAAFAAAYGRLHRPRHWRTPFVVGAGWVAAEFARTRLGVPNSWGIIGYSQAQLPVVIQTAEIVGVLGTSFCIATVNAAIAQAWITRRDGGTRSVARKGIIAAGSLLVVVLLYGALRLRAWTPDGEKRTVAIVQGSVPVSAQWSPERYGRNLDVYLDLTDAAIRDTLPALVVWPESAFTFFLDTEPAYRAGIAHTLAAGSTELLAGGPHATGRDGTFTNAAFLLGADGATRSRYDKQVLLPFAEYFPWGTAGLLQRPFGSVRYFIPGAVTPPLTTAVGRIGVLICNEAFFPELAAAQVSAGAEILAVLANDSWVGEERYARVAAAMLPFRAVEQRRDVIRASTWGPSGLIDARGIAHAMTATGTSTSIAARVQPHRTLTPYARCGDWFALLCAVCTLWRIARSRALLRHT